MSFYCSHTTYHLSIHAAGGFLLMAAAASLGVFRFGVFFSGYQKMIMRQHTLGAWVATIIGIPLIAAGFCHKYHKIANAQLHIFTGVAGTLVSLILPHLQENATTVVSTLAIFGIILNCFLKSNWFGVAGAVVYALAGVAIGTKGYFLGVRKVDWFHYVLCFGNLFLISGLQSR